MKGIMTIQKREIKRDVTNVDDSDTTSEPAKVGILLAKAGVGQVGVVQLEGC